MNLLIHNFNLFAHKLNKKKCCKRRFTQGRIEPLDVYVLPIELDKKQLRKWPFLTTVNDEDAWKGKNKWCSLVCENYK